MDRKQKGYYGEQQVCNYLETKGYKVVCKNFTIKGGEIDIIAIQNDIIAFIEVKARQDNCLVSGFEAVTKTKQKLIIKTAIEYLYKNPQNYQPRFDVAEVILINDEIIKINYIENAFDASGYKTFF